MTFVIKQEIINGNLLLMEQEKFENTYKVRACEMIDDCRARYPWTEKVYATKEQADKRYNSLKAKIKKEVV